MESTNSTIPGGGKRTHPWGDCTYVFASLAVLYHLACRVVHRLCGVAARILHYCGTRYAHTQARTRHTAHIRYLYQGSRDPLDTVLQSQSADSTVSSFVDSSAKHRRMRPNLIAMKNKNAQSQI